MKKTTLFHAARLVTGSILALSSLNAGAQQKQTEVFRWLQHMAKPGDTIQSLYRPRVPDSTPVKGYVYIYKDFKWRGYEQPLLKTDSGWLVSHVIPEGAAMIAYRFHLGDTVDRGGRFPYVMLLRDRKGQMAPGAYTEYALMRRRNIGGLFSPIVSPESEIEPKVVVQLYVSREWSNMLVRRHRFYEMAKAIKEYLPPSRTDSIVRQGAGELAALPDITEKELLSISKTYSWVLGDRKGGDSIQNLALAKYPNGIAYRMQLIGKLRTEQNAIARKAAWEDFRKKYPAAQYPYNDYLDLLYSDRTYFTNVLTSSAFAAYNEHDVPALLAMIKEVPAFLLPYFYTHYVIYPFRQQTVKITEKDAYVIGKAYMNEMTKRMGLADADSSGRDVYAASEWPAVWMRQIDAKEALVHYVKLMYDNGDKVEAERAARLIQPVVGMSDVTVNDVFTKMLVQQKKQKEAIAYIRSSIYANTVTPDMMKVLKADYVKQHGNENGFQQYVIALKSPEVIAKEQDAIRKTMMNVPSPAFDLLDTKGNHVSLASLKGKVVVLDFWATWCYYCKLAMPGMQMAVEHYKQDKEVAFYFVATLERDPRYKQMIDSFMTAKKYDFTVLYDSKNADSGELNRMYTDFAKVFHFNGIPEKIIIDQEGVVRWRGSGGSANHIALAEEITYIVDLLKKERKSKPTAAR